MLAQLHLAGTELMQLAVHGYQLSFGQRSKPPIASSNQMHEHSAPQLGHVMVGLQQANSCLQVALFWQRRGWLPGPSISVSLGTCIRRIMPFRWLPHLNLHQSEADAGCFAPADDLLAKSESCAGASKA